MKRTCAGVLALLVVGCGPMRVWRGQSHDHSRTVELIEEAGEQYLRTGEIEGVRYDAIAVDTIRFGRHDPRLAFAAVRGDRWVVAIDEVEGDEYDGIGQVVIGGSEDDVAYAAQRGEAWYAVRNHREGQRWDALRTGTLGIGDDGRLSYVGLHHRRAYVVVDEDIHGPFDAVVDLARAPGTGHVAFLALAEGSCVAHRESAHGAFELDSEPGRHEACGGLVWSPDGTRLAWVGRSRGCAQLVLDGVVHPECGVRPSSLVLGPRRVAYVREGDEGECVVVDGTTRCGWDEIEDPSLAGERWGVIARRYGRSHVLVDGRSVVEVPWATDLRLSRRGRHHAFITRRGNLATVVHDGRSWSYDVVIPGTLVLSDNGRHWACLTGDLESEELHLTVDGQPLAEFDFVEIPRMVAQYPSARDHDELLRRWTRAELRRIVASTR